MLEDYDCPSTDPPFADCFGEGNTDSSTADEDSITDSEGDCVLREQRSKSEVQRRATTFVGRNKGALRQIRD